MLMPKRDKKHMKRIRLPRGKWSRQQVARVVKRVLIGVIVVALLGAALWAAWPWLKEKGVIPVADNERRSPLHTSRDQQAYSGTLLQAIEANEAKIQNAEPQAKYEHYADKAEKLTAMERYPEAEQAFLQAEKTDVPKNDPRIGSAFYVSFGMMYETQGNDEKAHDQYLKSKAIREAMQVDESEKRISLEEINLLLERTKG